jgi:uncharacterized protein YjiS (DUF1127 family)
MFDVIVRSPDQADDQLRRLLAPFSRYLRAVACLIERQRQRRALGALTPRLLRDIGVSAEEAQRLVAKSFWRA